MCGFGGFWAIAGLSNDFDNTLRKIATTIAERGPDDLGAWHDAQIGIGLAHTRLSIVVPRRPSADALCL